MNRQQGQNPLRLPALPPCAEGEAEAQREGLNQVTLKASVTAQASARALGMVLSSAEPRPGEGI